MRRKIITSTKALAAIRKFAIYFLFIIQTILLPNSSQAETGIPSFSENFPPSFQNYLVDSLKILYSVQGSGGTPLHNRIFGGPVDGRVYRKWISERLKHIQMLEDDCSYTAKIDSEGKSGVVYISTCVNQNPDLDSRIYWLSVLIHEARHLEPQAKYRKHSIGIDEATGLMRSYDKSELGAFSTELVWNFNLLNFGLNLPIKLQEQLQDQIEGDSVWKKVDRKVESILRSDFHFRP
jgi:hypothetical protein